MAPPIFTISGPLLFTAADMASNKACDFILSSNECGAAGKAVWGALEPNWGRFEEAMWGTKLELDVPFGLRMSQDFYSFPPLPHPKTLQEAHRTIPTTLLASAWRCVLCHLGSSSGCWSLLKARSRSLPKSCGRRKQTLKTGLVVVLAYDYYYHHSYYCCFLGLHFHIRLVSTCKIFFMVYPTIPWHQKNTICIWPIPLDLVWSNKIYVYIYIYITPFHIVFLPRLVMLPKAGTVLDPVVHFWNQSWKRGAKAAVKRNDNQTHWSLGPCWIINVNLI